MLDTKKYNALDLAQPTNFKAMLRSGEVLWGTSCRIPHEESARIVATLPHHFCFLDSVQRTQNGQSCRPLLTGTGAYSAERNTAYQLDQNYTVSFQRLNGAVCPHSRFFPRARQLCPQRGCWWNSTAPRPKCPASPSLCQPGQVPSLRPSKLSTNGIIWKADKNRRRQKYI